MYNVTQGKEAGFTLLELMVVVAIVAILAGIAVPSMFNLIQDSRNKAVINHWIGLINFARSEAIRNKRAVVLCPSSDGASCNTGRWDAGALLFAGYTDDNTFTPASDDILRFIEAAPSDEINLSRTASSSTSGTDYKPRLLRFNPLGRLYSDDASNLVLCDDRGDESARAIVINRMGQPRAASDSDDDGIVEIIVDNALNNVSC